MSSEVTAGIGATPSKLPILDMSSATVMLEDVWLTSRVSVATTQNPTACRQQQSLLWDGRTAGLIRFRVIDPNYFGYVAGHSLRQHQLAFGECDPQRSHDQKGGVLEGPTPISIDIN